MKVLFTLVSKGCRKSENTTRKLVARRREVLCLVSLFKSFFDLGIFIFIYYVSDGRRERKKKKAMECGLLGARTLTKGQNR